MTTATPPTTHFAPPERAEGPELQRMIQYFIDNPDYLRVLDVVPDAVLILNQYRQVVYANRSFADNHGLEDVSEVYGQRPGELLGCVHANDFPGGCGTGESCALCGAPQAILTSLAGESISKECRITLKAPGSALDLRVHASPFKALEEKFSIFLVKDISDEKRRLALERTFFHDVLNTAGGLQGYTEMLADCDYEELDKMGFRQAVPRLTKQLVDEISAQRLLLNAENGQLELSYKPIVPKQILNEVADNYAKHMVAENRSIVVQADNCAGPFLCDHTLLTRVIGNMTKNALEACSEGQTVTLAAESGETWVEFSVNNPSVMPKDVQLQLFNRSFSTKGDGRGLGTYSIRLFGEKYLGGKVTFRSNKNEGTTFSILLPAEPE